MTKKQTAALAALLCCVSSANANLIDLTPGGFNWNNPPPIVTEWRTNTRPGLYLYPDSWGFFQVSGLGTTELTLTWSLPPRWTFDYLFVLDPNSNANFYQVPFSSWIHRGTTTVVIDGVTPIMFFTAYGARHAPDTGTTILLFGLTLIPLLRYARH